MVLSSTLLVFLTFSSIFSHVRQEIRVNKNEGDHSITGNQNTGNVILKINGDGNVFIIGKYHHKRIVIGILGFNLIYSDGYMDFFDSIFQNGVSGVPILLGINLGLEIYPFFNFKESFFSDRISFKTQITGHFGFFQFEYIQLFPSRTIRETEISLNSFFTPEIAARFYISPNSPLTIFLEASLNSLTSKSNSKIYEIRNETNVSGFGFGMEVKSNFNIFFGYKTLMVDINVKEDAIEKYKSSGLQHTDKNQRDFGGTFLQIGGKF